MSVIISIPRNKIAKITKTAIKITPIPQWWCWIPAKFATFSTESITLEVKESFVFDVQTKFTENELDKEQPLTVDEFKELIENGSKQLSQLVNKAKFGQHQQKSKAHVICKDCQQLLDKCYCDCEDDSDWNDNKDW